MTSFYITLSQLHTSVSFLRQLREVGFLVHFEGILSAAGKGGGGASCVQGQRFTLCVVIPDGEMGVLEDMCVAVAELSTIKFQVR